MKNILALAFFMCSVATPSLAQNCQELEGSFDYCHHSEQFPERVAGFVDGSNTFVFTSGKKQREYALQSDVEETLMALAADRKSKIGALDILFLQKALHTWEVEQRLIGYDSLESGLGIKLVKEGNGPLPEKGKEVTVHYTGWLLRGDKFDSSYDRDKPFSFKLGAGRVIKGWDEGVARMKKGSVAFLKIPPKLGYGSRGAGRAIPPNSTLIFKVEVLE